MKLFKSKKQTEALKEIGLLKSEKTLTKKLKLSRLAITFNIDSRAPYYAILEYKERPKDWQNSGVEESIRLEADSFPALIDEVLDHFNKS